MIKAQYNNYDNHKPAYNKPSYDKPSYEMPAYEKPTYEKPAYEKPAYNKPAYKKPAYEDKRAYSKSHSSKSMSISLDCSCRVKKTQKYGKKMSKSNDYPKVNYVKKSMSPEYPIYKPKVDY